MAMSTCAECGGKVSTSAATCPHCGAPDPAIDARKSQPELEADLLASTDEVALRLVAERILRRFPDSELAKGAIAHGYKGLAARRTLDELEPGAWYFTEDSRPDFMDSSLNLEDEATLRFLGLVRLRAADSMEWWEEKVGDKTLLCRISDEAAVTRMLEAYDDLLEHDWDEVDDKTSLVWRDDTRDMEVDARKKALLLDGELECVALRLPASADADEDSYVGYYALKGYYLFTDSIRHQAIHLGDVSAIEHKKSSQKRVEKLKLPGPRFVSPSGSPHYGTGALVGGLLGGPAGAVIGAAYAADRAANPRQTWEADALEFDIEVRDRFDEVVLHCASPVGWGYRRLVISSDAAANWAWSDGPSFHEDRGIEYFLSLLQRRIPAARAVRAAQFAWIDKYGSLEAFDLENDEVLEIVRGLDAAAYKQHIASLSMNMKLRYAEQSFERSADDAERLRPLVAQLTDHVYGKPPQVFLYAEVGKKDPGLFLNLYENLLIAGMTRGKEHVRAESLALPGWESDGADLLWWGSFDDVASREDVERIVEWLLHDFEMANAVSYPTDYAIEDLSSWDEPAEPGWLADPAGRHEYRYWAGLTWTDHVADGGIQSVDPWLTEEKRRLEAEETQKRAAKVKRVRTIALSVVAAAIAVAALDVFLVQPAIERRAVEAVEAANAAKQDAAVAAFEAGDFETAAGLFTELGDYEDSAYWSLLAEGLALHHEGKYELAVDKLQAAIDVGSTLDTSDAHAALLDAKYARGVQLMHVSFIRARELLSSLPADYKDVSDQLTVIDGVADWLGEWVARERSDAPWQQNSERLTTVDAVLGSEIPGVAGAYTVYLPDGKVVLAADGEVQSAQGAFDKITFDGRDIVATWSYDDYTFITTYSRE